MLLRCIKTYSYYKETYKQITQLEKNIIVRVCLETKECRNKGTTVL